MENLCDAEYFAQWAEAYTARDDQTYVAILHAHYEMIVRAKGGVPVGVSNFGKLLKFFGVSKPKRTKHGQMVQMVLKKTPEQERRAQEKAHQEEIERKKTQRNMRKLVK